MNNKEIRSLTKEDLLELIDIYSKNWLAMDGVWFQSVEQKYGMDEAIEHDRNAWRHYTKIEANRIKKFLRLPERSGIEGLKRALSFRIYANINEDEIITKDNVLIYRTLDCRVQNARKRKGMDFHPCKSVGIIEYTYFAKTIDDRFECEALSCYPEITDSTCNCSWKFTLKVRGDELDPP
ncbi:MAG: DUF6125 family protein, partial [Clostridiales bacterium]|nr:DUF6125 family protein [Clostridiales bacterium]